MKWFKNNIALVIGVFLVSSVVIGAGITQQFPSDIIKFGVGSSSDDKQLVIDTGDGVNNPTITIDMTNKDFDFNKALNIVATQMSLGDGTNVDTTWEFNLGLGSANPKFKWDAATSSLSFANDGVNFKKLGSGSGGGGGGINALAEDNPDFETADPPQSWTASGGTFSAETTAPINGDQSGSWDSNASAQTLDSVLAEITAGFVGRACQAEIKYSYPVGSNGDYKMVIRQFDDSGATEITVAELDLNVTTVGYVPAQLFFDCPDDAADDLRIRIESTVADADPILLDDAFIGTGRNSFQLNQASVYAAATWTGQAACAYTTTTIGSFESFPVDPDCPDPSVFGKAQIPPTKQWRLYVGDLEPGIYEVTFEAEVTAQTTPTDFNKYNLRIVDSDLDVGVTASHFAAVRSANTDTSISGLNTSKITAIFSYNSSKTNHFWEVQCNRVTGSQNCAAIATSSDGSLYAQVKKYPLNSAEAITLETTGFFLDVNIGGANPNLGTGNVASYTAIGDSGLDLVNNNPAFPAKIPCDGGNPSTGLTCSAGNEIIGVVFDAPTAGRYKACFEFSHQTSADVAGLSETTFQIIETADGSGTILSEGNSRIGSSSDVSSSATSTGAQPINLCGIFDFGSAGTKALKLAFEQSVAANFNSNIIRADRNVSIGQRDIHITVEKLTEQKPTPVFTDLQNSLNSKVGSLVGGTKVYSAYLDTDGSIYDEKGDWILSNVSGTAGRTVVNFQPGTFSTAPQCFVTSVSATNYVAAISAAPASTDFDIFMARTSDGVLIDGAFQMLCIGE